MSVNIIGEVITFQKLSLNEIIFFIRLLKVNLVLLELRPRCFYRLNQTFIIDVRLNDFNVKFEFLNFGPGENKFWRHLLDVVKFPRIGYGLVTDTMQQVDVRQIDLILL